jgi:hypothetical protein
VNKLIIAIGAVAALAACGSDDSTPSSTSNDSTTSAAADTTTVVDTVGDTTLVDTTGGDTSVVDTTGGEATDDTIVIESSADLPAECRDVIADALKSIEPTVKDIDWSTATSADFDAISPQLDEFGETLDTAVSAKCGKYVPPTEGGEAVWLSEIAAQEAPGTVGFVEVFVSLASEAEAAEFATCADATAALDELIATYPTNSEVPLNELSNVQNIITAITEVCSDAEQQEILTRPEVTVFLGG